MTLPLYLNGRFLAQRVTGVQRVARCLLQALDDQVPPGRWTLLCPPGVTVPPLRHIAVRTVGPAGWPLHGWEQLLLPWAARDGGLLSLAGTAPALARCQVALVHDAAVFDQPQAYTRAFVAWYRWLHRRLARRAVGLLTVSDFSRGRLLARLPLTPARVAVVHNGGEHLCSVPPDLAVLDRLGLRGRPFLLAVGSRNPTKNQAGLLAAWRQAAPAGVQLVLAGGGNAQVFASGAEALPAGVVDSGPLDDAGLVALYRHALALVFPSLYEGFGLPPLEAMALGCPVAVARVAALPEVCGDAVLYVDPAEPATIAAAMQRLVAEPALREQLRAAGLQRAAGFRWPASATQMRAVLQSWGWPA